MPFGDLSDRHPELLGPPVRKPPEFGNDMGMPYPDPRVSPIGGMRWPPTYAGDVQSGQPVADVGRIITVPDPSAVQSSATPAPTSGFDFSSLLSGNIMGIPTWIILAAAAYFMFFKKGR